MQLHRIYNDSLSLLTDFYQLTMACGYWKQGIDKSEAVYHLHFRKNPFQGGFTIAAGLESAISFLDSFHFETSDLDYLATLKDAQGDRYFCDKFLTYLSDLVFSFDIDAVPEGTVVFPQEPLVRVKGPLLQCQLLESPLLNIMNFPTLIATKAARVKMAAGNDSVLEFGMRRAQGIDGGITASRAAYVGGCDGTSNVLAGKFFGIPVMGTHAHSWITAFDDERESFRAFAAAMPGNTIFLVDTYDTLDGVRHAIEVGKELKEMGRPFMGIRLDSGDLAYLSIEARQMLDAAGFPETTIVASNSLDENVIGDLKKQGAKIASWGVGTKLATAHDQPALDGVYKLSAIKHEGQDWKYRLKLSEQMIKITNPGMLQVRRFYAEDKAVADVIFNELEPEPKDWVLVDPLDATREKSIPPYLEGKDLLVPIFRNGSSVYAAPPIEQIRQKTFSELASFHSGVKRFLNPHQYVVGMEQKLYGRKVELIKKIRKKVAV